MANSNISALTSATTPLAGTETLPIVQGGVTVKTTVANITNGGAYAGSFTTLASTGNTTLGDASTDTVRVNGYMSVGAAPSANNGLYVAPTALTGTGQLGAQITPTATSAATSSVRAVYARADTAVAAFTCGYAAAFFVANSTKGAGSTITDQHGVYISDLTSGTNNYGITSLVSSGANKWNVYASGTAANYFAGNVQFAAGTAAAPALTRFGDENTGIFFPAADTIAFSEGGAEAMRLDSSGQLGIGTSSPIYRLHVVSTATSLAAFRNSTAVNTQILVGNTAGDLSLRVISTGDAFIYSDTGKYLAFGANGSTERMRLDSAGNLGIGTTTPNASAILDAQSTTKGVRMPNMTTTQKNAIASPAAGLMVFDTTIAKLCVYSGIAWETITSI